MAGSDLKLNTLSFDYAAFVALFKQIIDIHLDVLSKFMIDTVRGQIWINGNGSYKVMRLFAAALVKETKREITNDHITLEVGIFTDHLPEDAFVRVSVVLHGNQAGGKLHEKPGIATWNKHVIVKRMPNPDNRNASNMLPEEFNQGEKMGDIMKHVQENVENNISKHVKDFVDAVDHDLSRLNWASFIRGG